ncbi:hypothetical protein GOODEAATRI_024381, partial [Goodea atripinnis]
NISQNGSCSKSQCGGAGCRDDQGNLLCGGEGCNGTVSSSLTALNEARNVTDNLKAAMEELQGVTKKVLKVSGAIVVKKQTMNALEKAQKKKEYFEKSNKDLKDLIKMIKDFLTGMWKRCFQVVFCTNAHYIKSVFWFSICPPLCGAEEGADPESIQKVAQQVLEIKLPFNRTTLDKMTMQIKDSIYNLSNVQGIVNQTSHLIRNAEELLNKAKEAE